MLGPNSKEKFLKFSYALFFFYLGGDFSMIFYFATFLFFICTISTLTSVKEEPLIAPSSSSSSRDIGDSNDNDDENDDDQAEIDVDEKRPLLSIRGSNSRIYNSNKSARTSASKYFSELNNQEGFIEVDVATGRTIPHDHVEGAGENILLRTLECSHQVVAASMNSDPSNPTPVPTQAFEAELKKKAKLIKLGI